MQARSKTLSRDALLLCMCLECPFRMIPWGVGTLAILYLAARSQIPFVKFVQFFLRLLFFACESLIS